MHRKGIGKKQNFSYYLCLYSTGFWELCLENVFTDARFFILSSEISKASRISVYNCLFIETFT